MGANDNERRSHLIQVYLAVISNQQAQRGGRAALPMHARAATDQAVFNALTGSQYLAVLQQDTVLDLGLYYFCPVSDACVGSDEGIFQAAVLADDDGTSHPGTDQARSLPDRHAPDDARVRIKLPIHALLQLVQNDPVGLQDVVFLARIQPPSGMDVRVDQVAHVNQLLDGVGDLQLSTGGRADTA